MTGYEANWSTPTVSQSGTAYYCETCKVPMGSLTSDPIHIRGPITLPADAVCAACGRSAAIPAAWLRIIESVLARVLAAEPAAQVVADYADEHGSTIQGLEKVERLLRVVEKWAFRWVKDHGEEADLLAHGRKPVTVDESLFAAYDAIKEPTDG